MRTIGLLGGMSWESTAVYYRRINEQTRDRLGGLHSAEVLMRSVDFDKIVALQQADAWDKAGAVLAGFARDLEAAGAACIVICTNTMHKLADTVQSAVTVPLLHIVDVTGQAVKAAGVKRPLLLATRYTMEQDFYLSQLRDKHGIAAMVPDAEDRTTVHDIIFDELCRGIVLEQSRQRYLDVIASEGGRRRRRDPRLYRDRSPDRPGAHRPADIRFHAAARRCRRRLCARAERRAPAQRRITRPWRLHPPHFSIGRFSRYEVSAHPIGLRPPDGREPGTLFR